MLSRVRAHSFAWLLPLVLLVPACGDDGGDASSTSTTSTTSSGGGGQGGEGGSGGGGAGGGGGGASACSPASPDVYDGAAFEQNASVELTVRDQFNALNDRMRSAEADLAVKPTLAELTALYEAGSPSVKDVTTEYYRGRVAEWLSDFADAAGSEWVPSATPTGPGGKYGRFIFSAEGTDLRQAVEKGLFTAAFYNHALSLLEGTRDAATVDRVLAVFGAHPTFPGDSETADTAQNPHPDRIGAQYAERRSPKDPNDKSKPADPAAPGLYFLIKKDFIAAQAAARAGAECDAERDAALARVMDAWERVMFATVVYYLNDVTLKLTKENPTVDDLAGGLHGYGEVVGFIHGFRGLPADGRTITDTQIDELLALLGAPAGQPATSYRLLTDAATEVPKLLQVLDEVASIYGFTPQDIEAFKINH